MAITRLNTPSTGAGTVIQTTTTNSSASVTIDASTSLLLVFVGIWDGQYNMHTNGSMTVGGEAMTLLQATDDVTDPESCSVWYRNAPLTGSRTLAWDFDYTSATADEGMQIVVVMYSGTDAGSPIVSSTKNTAGGDITSGLTANTGDMMVGAVAATTSQVTASDDGQTQVYSNSTVYNLNFFGIGEELSETEFYTTGGAAQSAVAVVIKSDGLSSQGPTTYTHKTMVFA